jgi:hydrogenase maturation protease
MNDEALRFWEDMERPGPESATVRGVEIRRGSRVRLKPRPGGDIMDLALAGRTAIVEGLDQDEDGRVHVTVAVDDDPGRDLGMQRAPAHRFFFRLEEVEPLERAPRVLVAGIGNLFLGDDGFGCEVARRFAQLHQPAGVTVRDFGIRGMDLAFELARFDVAILVDATRRGGEPGTLYVIDAATAAAEGSATIDTHGMDPVRTLALAHTLGPVPERVLVVGCEPAYTPAPDSEEIVGTLTDPVRAAIEPALELLGSLVAEALQSEPGSGSATPREEEA